MRSALLAIAFAVVPCLLLAACTPQNPNPSSPSMNDEVPVGNPKTAADAARTHLAARLNVDARDISVVETTQAEWSDSCLGLGGPAESCLAVMTPGFAVTLRYDGTEYVYRTDSDGSSVRSAE